MSSFWLWTVQVFGVRGGQEQQVADQIGHAQAFAVNVVQELLLFSGAAGIAERLERITDSGARSSWEAAAINSVCFLRLSSMGFRGAPHQEAAHQVQGGDVRRVQQDKEKTLPVKSPRPPGP